MEQPAEPASRCHGNQSGYQGNRMAVGTGWPWGQPGGMAASPLGTAGEGLPRKWGHDPPTAPWSLPAAPYAQASWHKVGTWGCRDHDGGDKPC